LAGSLPIQEALGHPGGLVLTSLAIAAGKRPQTPHHQRFAMLFYELIATGYLVQGMAGKLVGVLLWPAAALHAVLAILLAYASFSRTRRQGLFTAERR
jgi:hypothetical protein